MSVDADQVTGRLARTSLAGAAMTEVPLLEASTWVVDLPTGDLLPSWTQAREALADLGLYPVAITTWGEQGDWSAAQPFARFYYGDESTPNDVIAGARTLAVNDALGRFTTDSSWAVENWEDVVEGQLSLTRQYYDTAPDPSSVADMTAGDEVALERRLLEWEEALRPTVSPDPNASFGWFAPDEPVGLALLPIAEPCHAAAYLSFYGADGPGGHEALTRLMCSWQARSGAQLVANWGTMLQFVASNPPATLDDAFQLAVEHSRVAPCTTLLPGEGIRHLARHLYRGERWFLHERP
jgi:hypothetical protein